MWITKPDALVSRNRRVHLDDGMWDLVGKVKSISVSNK